MRKILVVLICLSSTLSFSQVTTSGTVMITNVWPSPGHCVGDSATLSFKFKFSGNTTNGPEWWFAYRRGDNCPYVPVTIRSFSYTEFYSLKKAIESATGDTIYTFKYLVPANSFSLGENVMIQINACPFTIPGKSVNMQNCTIAGIEELNPDNSPAVYLDFYQNVVTPQPGMFLIQRNGKNHKKVMITEQ